jgi:hypothetical protein
MKKLLLGFQLFSLVAVGAPSEKDLYTTMKNSFDLLQKQYFNLVEQVDLAASRASNIPAVCNGRLTTVSGAPYSDGSGVSTLYFTPTDGNRIALYTGSAWGILRFTELSLLSTSFVANNLYDAFAYNNSGALALEASAAWASNTARTDALAKQDGIWVKSSNHTRRYLGTFAMNGSNKFDDAANSTVGRMRRVWNNCTRLTRHVYDYSTTSSWTTSSTSWENLETSGEYQVTLLVGLQETLVHIKIMALADTAASQAAISTGIGINSSTTTNSALIYGGNVNATTGRPILAEWVGYPQVGLTTITGLDKTDGSTITLYGENGGDMESSMQVGIEGI